MTGTPRSLTIADLERAFRERTSHDLGRDGEASPEAAVAALFAPLGGEGVGLLLIERAHHPGDPWSGQIGLPGGRRDPGDADRAVTAIRETHEEVGIVLPRSALLAALPPIQARRRGLRVDLWVHPLVFALPEAPAPGVSREVRSSRWVAVSEIVDPANATTQEIDTPEGRLRLPAVRLDAYLLWGLTYRILHDVFGVLGLRLPGHRR